MRTAPAAEARGVRLRDGDEIAARLLGPPDAPALCLVPGLGGVASFFEGIAPALARDFRVLLHDHRGTGESTPAVIDYSIGQMADDLLQVMDAFGLARAAVVGHSTGGAIAQTIALDRPERATALVLSSTWAAPDAFLRALFELRLDVLTALGPAAYLRFAALLLRPPAVAAAEPGDLAIDDETALQRLHDPRIAESRIRALLAHDRRADIARLSQPTLVTCAADDRVTPPHLSRELAALIPGATLWMAPDGGHFLPEVRPAAFLEAVHPFLVRHARP